VKAFLFAGSAGVLSTNGSGKVFLVSLKDVKGGILQAPVIVKRNKDRRQDYQNNADGERRNVSRFTAEPRCALFLERSYLNGIADGFQEGPYDNHIG
jgi:hypothetical protein